ncbi:DUF5593 domain-containing protein [Nocardia iowensis]|uniref:DUF5593 domain-containing protein n=1 Tax=Nocardia iowensis TaxID=204891 RepID=A0ABX8RY24_NOCIO|nr:DUF5593 domain-containing protein [Nocardia iowensis]
MEHSQNEVLIETIGSDPRVVWAASRTRDARIANVFRGAERMLVERLVKDVVNSGVSAVRAGREGTATGQVYAAYPVVGPDNAVSGVQIVYGPEPGTPTAPTAAYQWELDANDGPPRLHTTRELLDILEVPERQRDRPPKCLWAVGLLHPRRTASRSGADLGRDPDCPTRLRRHRHRDHPHHHEPARSAPLRPALRRNRGRSTATSRLPRHHRHGRSETATHRHARHEHR